MFQSKVQVGHLLLQISDQLFVTLLAVRVVVLVQRIPDLFMRGSVVQVVLENSEHCLSHLT
jgi:hypothetical protein